MRPRTQLEAKAAPAPRRAVPCRCPTGHPLAQPTHRRHRPRTLACRQGSACSPPSRSMRMPHRPPPSPAARCPGQMRRQHEAAPELRLTQPYHWIVRVQRTVGAAPVTEEAAPVSDFKLFSTDWSLALIPFGASFGGGFGSSAGAVSAERPHGRAASTGLRDVDWLLGGGLATGEVTEIFGGPSVDMPIGERLSRLIVNHATATGDLRKVQQ